MLNNLSNFFNIIVGRRIKTQLENSDLIAIGTKQSPALGDYKPTAIQYSDLEAQILASIPPVPDPAVNYSNVVFVDAVNGNDSTGLINRFDKPFLTVSAAISAAAALSGISLNKRALVYIRRGEYSNLTVSLQNYVDIYCENGVVFSQYVYISDFGSAVNCSIMGYLKIYAKTSATIPFKITGGSTINFEFDWIDAYCAAIEISTVNPSYVTITGNSIASDTIGTGYGVTVRYAANVYMDIKKSISAPHNVLNSRFFSGTWTLKCPKIVMTSPNVYGAGFKQGYMPYDASSTGVVKVFGDFVNEDPVNHGSLVNTNDTPVKLYINGNLYANNSLAVNGKTAAAGKLFITGDITSNYDYTVWAWGSGQLVFNGNIYNTGAIALASAVAVNGTAQIFFRNGSIYNAAAAGPCLVINSAGAVTVLDNMTLFTNNTDAVTTTIGPANIRANASRSNKGLQIGVTDLYSPSGFIVDVNTVVPTSIL